MARARRLTLAALVVAASATRALAQDEEPDPAPVAPAAPVVDRAALAPAETVVGVGGASPDAVRVVTSAGRVFARGEGGAWARRSAGGVGTPLLVARSFASADVWAAGAAPPAFRLGADAATWSAVPVRRSGAAHLGTCATPGFASGRRVFAHDGKHWKELRRLPGAAALVSLCLVDAGHGAALLDDGTLLSLAGGWKPLLLPGAPAKVTWLGGGATPLAQNARGELYRLDGAKPARVVADAPVAARAAFSTARHTFLLGEGGVFRLDGRKLVTRAALPAERGAHDWLGLVAADDGTVVLVARDGTVARRSASGEWSKESALVVEAPGEARAANPPARVGP